MNDEMELFEEEFERTLRKLKLKEGYIDQRKVIVEHFSDYDSLDLDGKRKKWFWFEQFVLCNSWTRGRVYYFLIDFRRSDHLSEELKGDIDEYSDMLTGGSIRQENWIIFPDEPTGDIELDNYVHSTEWRNKF